MHGCKLPSQHLIPFPSGTTHGIHHREAPRAGAVGCCLDRCPTYCWPDCGSVLQPSHRLSTKCSQRSQWQSCMGSRAQLGEGGCPPGRKVIWHLPADSARLPTRRYICQGEAVCLLLTPVTAPKSLCGSLRQGGRQLFHSGMPQASTVTSRHATSPTVIPRQLHATSMFIAAALSCGAPAAPHSLGTHAPVRRSHQAVSSHLCLSQTQSPLVGKVHLVPAHCTDAEQSPP